MTGVSPVPTSSTSFSVTHWAGRPSGSVKPTVIACHGESPDNVKVTSRPERGSEGSTLREKSPGNRETLGADACPPTATTPRGEGGAGVGVGEGVGVGGKINGVGVGCGVAVGWGVAVGCGVAVPGKVTGVAVGRGVGNGGRLKGVGVDGKICGVGVG